MKTEVAIRTTLKPNCTRHSSHLILMASNDKLPSKLLDCHFFYENNCKNGESCRYRHCEAAKQTTDTCPKWLKHYSCRNFDCEHRHPTPVKRKPIKTEPPRTPPRSAGSPIQQRRDQEGIVAFFWDYENCQIPKGSKAFDVVRRLKDKFVLSTRLNLVGFICYGDVTKLTPAIREGLELASVELRHAAGKPNIADRKIFIDLDTFEAAHRGEEATVILITGDIDFIGKIDSLRHRARFRVLLLHNEQTRSELLDSVDEHYLWSKCVQGDDGPSGVGRVPITLPRGPMRSQGQPYSNPAPPSHPQHPIRVTVSNQGDPQHQRPYSPLLRAQPVPIEENTPKTSVREIMKRFQNV